MPEPITYEEAKRDIESKLGFFSHVAVYVMVNGGLLLLNLATAPTHFWAHWPMMGWAIGLTFHGIRVFFKLPLAQWKQRMIAGELEKYNRPPSA